MSIRILAVFFLTVIVGCASQSLQERVHAVNRLIIDERYEDARRQTEQLAAQYPDAPEIALLRAKSAYYTKDYATVVHSLESIDETLRTLEGNVLLGQAYYYLGRHYLASTVLAGVIAEKPEPELIRMHGLASYMAKDMPSAIPSLREACLLFPDDALCHYTLGNAIRNGGESSKALSSLLKAAELEPDNDLYVFEAGTTAMITGQTEKAIVLFGSIPPDSKYGIRSAYMTAEAYAKLGNYRKAATFYRYCAERERDPSAIHRIRYALAITLIDAEEYHESLRVLKELEEDTDNDPRIPYHSAVALMKLGMLEKALSYFPLAIDLDKDNIVYRTAYAEALTSAGHIEAAVRQIEAILTLEPENRNARRWLMEHRTVK